MASVAYWGSKTKMSYSQRTKADLLSVIKQVE